MKHLKIGWRDRFYQPIRAFVSPSLMHWLVLLFSAWSFPCRPANALLGDSEGPIGLDGSVRTITLVSLNYDRPEIFGQDNRSDGLEELVLREILSGYPMDWFTYEIHCVQMLAIQAATAPILSSEEPAVPLDDRDSSISTGGTGAILTPQTTTTPYRIYQLQWEWDSDNDVRPGVSLDRFNFKIRHDFADLTLGRQAITFGKAYFFNPLDVFLAFSSTQFDRDYKQGVDALRIDIPVGLFSGFNLIGVLGDLQYRHLDTWQESAILGRAFTNQWDWDFSIQGGKIRGGYQIGIGATGELFALEVRGEAAYFFQESNTAPDQHLSAAAGLGKRFESGLWIQAEYFYNGGADSGEESQRYTRNLQLIRDGYLQHFYQHLTGLVSSYEFLPILIGSLAWIQDWEGLSAMLQPGINYSAADEVDLLLGAAITIGKHPRGNPPELRPQNEFGIYPHFFYFEAKVYF